MQIKNFHKELMDLIVKYDFTQVEINSKPLETGSRYDKDVVVHDDKIDFNFKGIFQVKEEK